ncbi:hypothetical protein niasHT_018905 [Heterodera trifolii]|uniref:F-box domain-containing protein n=1 Tax=Heterodera trifolii TaxID=157864 RepID=A0ABD2LF31_9BILA
MMTDACGLTEKHSKVRLHLPLELQCGLLSALPFEHAARLLLLSKAIAKNCNSLVQKQTKGWKAFSEKCVDKLMKFFHPFVLIKLESIEKEHHSFVHSAEHQEDKLLKEEIRLSRVQLSPLVGANLVRRLEKCGTAGEAMTELLNSVVKMYHIIEQYKKRRKEMDERFNDVKRMADGINLKYIFNLPKCLFIPPFWHRFCPFPFFRFVPHDIPPQICPTATVWSAERLRRDYTDHLHSLRVRLRQIKKAHRKKIKQIGVCKQISEWYGELKMHRRIILDQWRALLRQKTKQFDYHVWSAQMLSELEANNALTVIDQQQKDKCIFL